MKFVWFIGGPLDGKTMIDPDRQSVMAPEKFPRIPVTNYVKEGSTIEDIAAMPIVRRYDRHKFKAGNEIFDLFIDTRYDTTQAFQMLLDRYTKKI